MSRQDVLALLREQEGAFVSGEEISHRLGLSRAAIWKAVDALRREGYTVEAPHRPGLPSAGCAGRADGAGDPPLSGGDGPGGPDLGVSGRGGLHQSPGQTAGSGGRSGRHCGGGGPPDGWPGPTGPELSVPRRPGDLPDGPAAAGSAAGAAVAGDGHGWSSGVSGRRAAVRRQPRPENGPTIRCWMGKSSAVF